MSFCCLSKFIFSSVSPPTVANPCRRGQEDIKSTTLEPVEKKERKKEKWYLVVAVIVSVVPASFKVLHFCSPPTSMLCNGNYLSILQLTHMFCDSSGQMDSNLHIQEALRENELNCVWCSFIELSSALKMSRPSLSPWDSSYSYSSPTFSLAISLLFIDLKEVLLVHYSLFYVCRETVICYALESIYWESVIRKPELASSLRHETSF